MNPLNALAKGFGELTTTGTPANNALRGGVGAFARGFIGPEGVAKIQDRRHELKQREDADVKTKLAKTKAWLEQTRQIPATEREAWTMQNAEAIFRDTGQRPSMGQGGMAGGMGANPYDDAELDKGIAAISAQLGQGTQAQYGSITNLGDGGVGAINARTGKFETIREPTPDPKKAVKPDIKEGGNGNWWERDAVTGQWKDTGVKAPAKSDSNGIDLTFGEGGALSGLSIGGSAPKGKDAAIVRGPDNQPLVSPGPQQQAANKAYKSLQDFEAQNSLVLEEVDRALGAVKPSSTGPMAATADLPVFGPSTDAGRLKNLVTTIKANVGFDKLQSMRENSPTGGALGQVAIQEIEFLQAVFGSLETAQREEDVRYNLTRLRKFLAGRGERLRAAYAQDYPDLNTQGDFRGAVGRAAKTAGPQPGEVQDGYRFKGGDPANPASWEPVQ